jgi:hypothetical protein
VTPDAQTGRSPFGRGEQRMVPPARPGSYYGRPILKRPVWIPEIAVYFFFGGMAGASAPLAAAARAAGNLPLARRASLVALVGAGVSPALLIVDLGRPARFLNMLRVFKLTSPMSVGTWILSTFGPAAGVAAGWQVLGLPDRRLGVPAQAAAAVLGPPLSTYTAVLIAQTSVPVWHDARRELPLLFAGSSLAAAGGANAMLTPRAHAAPARALGVAGAVVELAAGEAMRRRLDPVVRATYEAPGVAPLDRASRVATLAGAALLAFGARRSRAAAIAGGAALCAGSLMTRLAVFRAGTVSADDPDQTVVTQKARRNGRRPVKTAA